MLLIRQLRHLRPRVLQRRNPRTIHRKLRPLEAKKEVNRRIIRSRLQVRRIDIRVPSPGKSTPDILDRVGVVDVIGHSHGLIEDIVCAEDFVQITAVAAVVWSIWLSYGEGTQVVKVIVAECVASIVDVEPVGIEGPGGGGNPLQECAIAV